MMSVFGQMLCAITGRAVRVSESQTGTSVGAAMLINNADTPPGSRKIEMDEVRRKQLQRYAGLWQQALQRHVR